MYLTNFISSLINSGSVSVPAALNTISREDEQSCLLILQEYYTHDTLEQAGAAPAFSPATALWAAKYFYHAIQLTAIREANKQTIQQLLQPFTGFINAGAMYSVDLIFRHLPSLLLLAKGLAPSDPLVATLRQSAMAWPLAAVGLDLKEEIDIASLSSDAFLWQLFIDRIIKHKDKQITQHKKIAEGVSAVLGNYTQLLWPEFESVIKR